MSESLIETKPGSIELVRAKRIRGVLGLLGLLGLLGGGSVLVTKAFFAEKEALESSGAAERADEAATQQPLRTADPGAPRGH